MALTEAQKRANKNEELRRKALGDCKVTIWFSAQAKVRLDELTAKYGTRQKAVEAALMGSATVEAPKVVNDEDRAFLEAAHLAWVPPDKAEKIDRMAAIQSAQRAEKLVAKPSKVFGHPKPGKR